MNEVFWQRHLFSVVLLKSTIARESVKERVILQDFELPQTAVLFTGNHFLTMQHGDDLMTEADTEYRQGEVSKHFKVREKARTCVADQRGVAANDDGCWQVGCQR